MIVMVKLMKKYFLAFIIPIFVLILAFIFNDVIFGDFSAFVSDAQLQYQQLLVYLKHLLEGSSSLFYTFQVGFGTPLISTLAYYLMSPFNIFVKFLGLKILKLVFCFYLFLRSVYVALRCIVI